MIRPGGLQAGSITPQKGDGILDSITASIANSGFEFLLHIDQLCDFGRVT